MRVKPMIALSGVRSSCDMLARNALLCRLATSSSRLLSSSSLNRRAFSMRDRRLRREGAQQLDHVAGANAPATRRLTTRPPSSRSSAQQRHGEQRAIAEVQHQFAHATLVDGLVADLAIADRLAADRHHPEGAFAARDRRGAQRLDELVGQRMSAVRSRNASRAATYSYIAPPSMPGSCVACATIVASTVSRSSVELDRLADRAQGAAAARAIA